MIRYKIIPFTIFVFLLLAVQACNDDSPEVDPCAEGPEIATEEIVSTVIGKTTGAVSVSASAGTPPYSFSIDGLTFQSSAEFTGLAAGKYEVIVIDGLDCTASLELDVPEVPEVFYSNQIRPIIDADCQKSGCHGSNTSIPSWETYEEVKAYADLIKLRTSDKTMPPTGALNPTKIKLIADWVDQGAPNN